jgi:hypothetical protein
MNAVTNAKGMSVIEYVSHPDIASQQWDQCIRSSFNGSLEAYSWYLNLFCDQWDALIEGDYKTVMPLPVKKRLGQTLVYMPPLISQLGIYSPEQLSIARTNDFLTLLKKKFRSIHIGINKYTPVPEGLFPICHEAFYELDLIRPYMRTVMEYSQECRNRIHLASARQYSIVRGIATNDVITFFKREKIRTETAVMENDFKLLRMLIASLVRYKAGELYGAYNHVNMLSCVALFVWSNTNAMLIFAADSLQAIEDNAHMLVVDHFIEKYSETNVTLNFEYKNIHHTPALYRSFGATESQFQQICVNHFPFLVRPLFR